MQRLRWYGIGVALRESYERGEILRGRIPTMSRQRCAYSAHRPRRCHVTARVDLAPELVKLMLSIQGWRMILQILERLSGGGRLASHFVPLIYHQVGRDEDLHRELCAHLIRVSHTQTRFFSKRSHTSDRWPSGFVS